MRQVVDKKNISDQYHKHPMVFCWCMYASKVSSVARNKITYHVSPQFPSTKIFRTILVSELSICSGFMIVNMTLTRTNSIRVKKCVLLTIGSSTFKPETIVNSPNPTRTEMKAMANCLVRRSEFSGRMKYTRAYQATKSTIKGIISFKRLTYDQPCQKLVTRSITMTNRGASSLTRLKAISDSRASNSYALLGCCCILSNAKTKRYIYKAEMILTWM